MVGTIQKIFSADFIIEADTTVYAADVLMVVIQCIPRCTPSGPPGRRAGR